MEEGQVVHMEQLQQFVEEKELSPKEQDSNLVHKENESAGEVEMDLEELAVEKEFEEIGFIKTRKINSSNLDSMLKGALEIFSKVKAKEEVELCTIQNDIHEIRETRKHIEKEIDSLVELKKELQVSVEIGAIERLKTQKRVEDTLSSLTAMKGNYQNLEEFEKLVAQDMTNLDSDYVALVNYYRTEKDAWMQKIATNKEIVDKTRAEIKNLFTTNNSQVEQVQKKLEKFLKNEKEEEESLDRLTKKYEECRKQFYDNQLELFKEELECKNLQNQIDNIDLEAIEKQKMVNKMQQDATLNIIMTKAADANRRLEEIVNSNSLLKDELDEDRRCNSDLQEKLSTLDNENANLIAVNKKLQESLNKTNINLKLKQDLIQSKLSQANIELTETNTDHNLISKRKMEVLQQVEELEKEIGNLKEIFENLLQIENECKEKIQLEVKKGEEVVEKNSMLEEEGKRSKLLLTETLEVLKKNQQANLTDSELLANRLSETKKRFLKIAQENDIKIKARYQERKSYERNFEETNKENLSRNERELTKLRTNMEMLKKSLEESKQQMQQLESVMKEKVEACNVLKKEVDDIKMAESLKNSLPLSQNSSKSAVVKSKAGTSTPEIVELDTTTIERGKLLHLPQNPLKSAVVKSKAETSTPAITELDTTTIERGKLLPLSQHPSKSAVVKSKAGTSTSEIVELDTTTTGDESDNTDFDFSNMFKELREEFMQIKCADE